MTQARVGLIVAVYRLIRPLFSSRAALIESMTRDRATLRTAAADASSNQLSAVPLADAFADDRQEPDWDKILVFCRLIGAWHLFWLVITPLTLIVGLWWSVLNRPDQHPAPLRPGESPWVGLTISTIIILVMSVGFLWIVTFVFFWISSLMFPAYARFVGRLVRLPVKINE